MHRNHNLIVKLNEWRDRIIRSGFLQFDNSCDYFFNKIKKNPELYPFLSTSHYLPSLASLRAIDLQYELPEWKFKDEEQEAVMKFAFLQFLLEQSEGSMKTWLFNISGGNNYKDAIGNFVESYINPVVIFLSDQLEESSNMLYLLEKYKSRSEWFFRESLTKTYQNNSRQGESKLEEDLRLFLFDQGIDYPFSTPSSASGRADVVSMLHTDDPLVLEIKVYDETKGYKLNRIIDGFSQIVKYANDYNKYIGYLVVFNMDAINFEIKQSETVKSITTKIIFEGKSFYLIFINLNQQLTASKAGIIKTQSISVNDLTTSMA
jgi:hypothetical protein